MDQFDPAEAHKYFEALRTVITTTPFDTTVAGKLFRKLCGETDQVRFARASSKVFVAICNHYECQIERLENRISELEFLCSTYQLKPPSMGTTTKEQHHE